jgi:hypothetical protein
MTEKQSPAVADTTQPGQQCSRVGRVMGTKPLCKWKRVLLSFIDGQTWNRFEVERTLGDHCLHSTVAELERRGVRIERQREVVQGRYGAAHVKRYRLNNTAENIVRAHALVDGDMGVDGGAEPKEVCTRS